MQCPSVDERNLDYIRELNNFLQRPRRAGGDLKPHLSWILGQTGPDNQKTHYATARCEPFSNSDKLSAEPRSS